MARKKLTVKFNKTIDTGPQQYQDMDKGMADTIHKERIRRQITSHLGAGKKKKGY